MTVTRAVDTAPKKSGTTMRRTEHPPKRTVANATKAWLHAMARIVVACVVLSGSGPAMAIEEPDHTVVRTIDDIEIRDYPAFVVAEVEVAGTADSAGSQAFPILAGYIFGKNRGERKFAMTAPVVQTEAPIRLPMTAPVTQAQGATGYIVQFVLPKAVTVASAPEPLDPRVRIRDEPARRVAVVRYSGLWSAANYAEHLAHLRDVLAAQRIEAVGEPVFARYNAPFTPWFLRRNEIWIRIGPGA